MRLHPGESEPLQTLTWEQRAALGQKLLLKLAQDALNWRDSASRDELTEDIQATIPQLTAQLELDGYVFKNGHLYFSEAGVWTLKRRQG